MGSARPTERVTKTFMFTDIVNTSTDLVGLIGDEAWSEVLHWHDRELRSSFAAHRGEEVTHHRRRLLRRLRASGRRDRMRRRRPAPIRAPPPRARLRAMGPHRPPRGRGDAAGPQLHREGVHVAARVGAVATREETPVLEHGRGRGRSDPLRTVGAALGHAQGCPRGRRGSVGRLAVDARRLSGRTHGRSVNQPLTARW